MLQVDGGVAAAARAATDRTAEALVLDISKEYFFSASSLQSPEVAQVRDLMLTKLVDRLRVLYEYYKAHKCIY